MSRIEAAFAAARADGRAAFIPYLTAGFPDEARFLAAAEGLLELADLLEVGLPYSDPLGDGPTIQRSSQAALERGVTPQGTLRLVERLRRLSDKPIVVMSYYNPIFTYPGGESAFAVDLVSAGGNGVILPDLPPEEGPELTAAAREAGLDTIFLVAPTSTDERLGRVTEQCRGFVYAVSVTGVTGARTALGGDVPGLVERLRRTTRLPVAVGFGVSGGETARAVASVADGVVVGSAIVAKLAADEDPMPLAREIAANCRLPGERRVAG